MRIITDAIGFNFVTQSLLILLWVVGEHYIVAAQDLYRFSPSLFYFYTVGTAVVCWALYSMARISLFRSGLGQRANRHSRTRGHQ